MRAPTASIPWEGAGSFRSLAEICSHTAADDLAFTMVTDAYSVNGDVLTVHRQLTSVNGTGEIRVMQGPTGNFRQTYLYRRSP